ncbi:MAG: hypothetical protein LC658_02800, partial [Bacteroidales bacterium]|nr:hypothetical protein [Bacteroidales bacterium]
LLVRQLEMEPGNLQLLMDLAFNEEHPKSWRAAYIADKINDNHPELISPFILILSHLQIRASLKTKC